MKNLTFGIFDKVYVLTLTTRKDRYLASHHEMSKLGILDNIKMYAVTNLEINNKLVDNSCCHFNDYICLGEFSCVYNHLLIISEAYHFGYDHILICEDDIHFNEDRIKEITKLFETTPQDFDLVKYWNTYNEQNDEIHSGYFKSINTINDVYRFAQSTACYALSRRGMRQYLQICKNELTQSDMVFLKFNPDILKMYVAKNRDLLWINDGVLKSEILSNGNKK